MEQKIKLNPRIALEFQTQKLIVIQSIHLDHPLQTLVTSSPIYSSKACKPPKCPLTDAWIKNTCTHTHKYTME